MNILLVLDKLGLIDDLEDIDPALFAEAKAAVTNPPAAPVYEYMALWAEETSTARTGSSQWSFGNGATGRIGIKIGDGWEIIEASVHAALARNGAEITVGLVDYQGAQNVTIGALPASLAEGHGTEGNLQRIVALDPALPVPDGAVLGVQTLAVRGSVGNTRAFMRCRRLVGSGSTEVVDPNHGDAPVFTRTLDASEALNRVASDGVSATLRVLPAGSFPMPIASLAFATGAFLGYRNDGDGTMTLSMIGAQLVDTNGALLSLLNVPSGTGVVVTKQADGNWTVEPLSQ